MAVDPLAGKYPHLSPYVFVANSALVFIDPDGKKIINADRLRKEKAINEEIGIEDLKMQFGTLHNRKKFTGTEDDWNMVQGKLKVLNVLELDVLIYTRLEEESENAITEFRESSPNLFRKMDMMRNEYREPVDAYLGTVDLFDQSNAMFPGVYLGVKLVYPILMWVMKVEYVLKLKSLV